MSGTFYNKMEAKHISLNFLKQIYDISATLPGPAQLTANAVSLTPFRRSARGPSNWLQVENGPALRLGECWQFVGFGLGSLNNTWDPNSALVTFLGW